METFGIAFLFVVMVASPCIIALRSSGQTKPGNTAYGEVDEEPDFDFDDLPEPTPVLAAVTPVIPVSFPADRPLTLSDLALRAEADARIAQELAHEAHYAALAAAAYAARLRADAAIEAAQLAEQAIRDIPVKFDGEYFGTNPSPLEAKAGRAA